MFAPLFYPHIGGVEKHVKRVSEELVEGGHEVTIITVKHEQALPDFEELNKVKIYRFSGKRLPQIWLWLYKHRKLIRTVNIIHCHDFVTFIFWYLPFRFLYFFKPVFVTFHGYEVIPPIPKKILFMRKVAEFLTRGNICIGDYIPKWYGTKADFVLYGGADEPTGKSRSNNNTINDEIAVFVGRLGTDTGIMVYINTIRILKERYGVNLKVDVCAEGNLRQTIEDIVNKNDLAVKLHGFVENPTDYLVKGKFAFVSGYLAILEAMINKKLVFAVYENELKKDYLTLLPNSEDMMVTASTPDELAQKIAHYCKNPEETEEKVATAYNFAKEQTWQKVANTYLKLWGI